MACLSGNFDAKPGLDGVQLNTGTRGNLVTTITDGLGRTTQIAYKAAKDDSVYTPGAAVSYPIREIRGSNPVVSEVYKDSGSTNPAHFSYQYSGNRLDLSGRGSLGFHSFVTLDRQTKLFKYQFLTQSFPMTGLTAREQTYRYWEQGSDAKFRYINSHDNTVVFDEVVNSSGSPYGTVYPFISKAVESRWEDATTEHYSFTKTSPSGGPESKSKDLFKKALPGGSHITVSAKSWFDNQSLDAGPQLTIPQPVSGSASANAPSYQASDRTGLWSADGINSVVGSTDHDSVHALAFPRKITFGNLKRLSTNFGDGFTEQVDSTYFTPSAVGGFTGLVQDVTTTVGWKEGTTDKSEVAPIKRYKYWKNGSTQTPLVETETVDATDDKLDLTTTYARDSLGRVTSTVIAGYNNPGTASGLVLGSLDSDPEKAYHVGSFTASTALVFDPNRDVPTITQNAQPYAHTTIAKYDPYSGLPISVKDVNGAEVTTTYDALGRKVKVRDELKGLDTRTNYAWTINPGASDWTQQQPVTPPSLGGAVFNGVAADSGIEGVSAISATSAYAARTSTTAQPTVVAYYDRLGRVIRTVKEGFNNTRTVTDTVYNTLGQVVAVSLPYSPADSSTGPFWTFTAYDALGRVAKTIAPNGTVTRNSYRGRITQVTVDAPDLGGIDPAEQTNSTLVDAKGRTIKVWNANNSPALTNIASTTLAATTSTPASIEYVLDGFGRMRTTVLSGQSQPIIAEYDALGRQTSLDDPDKGRWTYVNNALGQVVSQTDAKGTVTRTTFDRLGRPLARQTTETTGPVETADWYYYDASTLEVLHTVAYAEQGWIGAPQREMSRTTGAPGYGDPGTASIHYYDTKGRPALSLNEVDDKFFYTAHQYDQYSRPQSVRYFWRPAGVEDPKTPYYWNDWGYTYQYDTESYLLKMLDSAGRIWWQADSTTGYDHLDRPVRVRKGDGHWTTRTYRDTDGLLTGIATGPTAGSAQIQDLKFAYDGLGNLKQRVGAATEDFTYDNLNRLSSGGVAYAANGNITTKMGVDGSDGGTYAYAAKVTIGGVERTLPHAVSSAFGNTYTYDANGNMLTRAGGGHTWSTKWAGFDKPRWLIDCNTAAGTAKGDEFTYNANRSRVVHLSIDGVAGAGATAVPNHYSRKKVYGLGPQLEADYVPSLPNSPNPWTLQKIRIYVPGPEGTIGTMEFNPGAPFDRAEQALVYHYDHLGSIERITPYGSIRTIDSATEKTYVLDGADKPSRYSYDAWGQRRNADTWSGKPPADANGKATLTANGGDDDATPRGFTGHEMLDDIGLVHMNGRIYDPLLGRFLSADLIVQNPASLQSYNRYTYVLNNPLTLNDPSGFAYQDEQAEQERKNRQHATDIGVVKEYDNARTKAGVTTAVTLATTLATGGGLGLALPNVGGTLFGRLLISTAANSAGAVAGNSAGNVMDGKPIGENTSTAGTIGAIFGFIGQAGSEVASLFKGSTAASTTTTAAADSVSTATPATSPVKANAPAPAPVEPSPSAPAQVTQGTLYRSGGNTPATLTPRPVTATHAGDPEGLSTFTTIEAATKPGGKVQTLDASKIETPLVAVLDDATTGHVSIRPGAQLTPETSQATADWAATRGTSTVHPLTDLLRKARTGEMVRPL